MNKLETWMFFVLGILAIFGSVVMLQSPDGGSLARGVFVPSWVAWPLLLLGVIICLLAIHGIRRGEDQSRCTDEDFDRAKAAMDSMYLREHGVLPDPPDNTEEKPHGQFAKETKKQFKQSKVSEQWGLLIGGIISLCIGGILLDAEVGDYPWGFSIFDGIGFLPILFGSAVSLRAIYVLIRNSRKHS